MTILIKNREDTRWLMACRTIGTDMLIILTRLLSLDASLVAAHILESFVPISQFEGLGDAS